MKAKNLTLNITFQLITDIRCFKFMVGLSINDAHFGGHILFLSKPGQKSALEVFQFIQSILNIQTYI